MPNAERRLDLPFDTRQGAGGWYISIPKITNSISLMRYQGKITNWKDDQGFGFVTPNGGGERVFVHIKAFSRRSRRPIEGDLITYELGTDESRRIQANNIIFVGEQSTATARHKDGQFDTIFAILFCSVLIFVALTGRLPSIVLGVYLALSVLTFLVYAIDKSAARNNRWRTKESTLHLFSMVGGWPGALLAQKILRHKSKKEEFRTVFWVTVLINCFALGWLLSKSGSSYLRMLISSSA